MTRTVSLAIMIAGLVVGLFLMEFFRKKEDASLNAPANQHELIDVNAWYEFTEPQGHFKVFMPGLPHHATDTNQELKSNEIRKYELYISSKDDGTLYSIYLITFPERKEKDMNTDFLMNFMNEMLSSNQQNKLQFIRPSVFNKDHAVDFSVENQEAMIDGKAFIQDNTVFVLSSTAKTELRKPKEYEFFVNSFHLGKSNQKTKDIK